MSGPHSLRMVRASATTQDVLRQHRDALEALRTAFNALEAKQRHQAHSIITLVELHEAHAKAIAGLRVACLWFARGLLGRLRWIWTGQ